MRIKEYWKHAVIVSIVVVFGVLCLSLSVRVMSGLVDCSFKGFLPEPPNCADDDTLLRRDALQIAAIMLFLVPIGWLIVAFLRRNRLDKRDLERELKKTGSSGS